jgi:hypothetical protein
MASMMSQKRRCASPIRGAWNGPELAACRRDPWTHHKEKSPPKRALLSALAGR